MKKYRVLLLVIVSLDIAAIMFKKNAHDQLRIVTYNIRRSGKEMAPTTLWENRKPLVFDMIQSLNPDIIGFQEVVKNQLNDLKMVMAGYDSFGDPRSAYLGGWIQKWVMKHPRATDEHNPIFYKKSRLELLDRGDFGINPTGRFKLFTAYLPRICTWGHFKDKQTGKTLYVYNTHLDNSSGIIRRRQINIIMKHVKKHTQGQPVIFMGDLNTSLKGKRKSKKLAQAGFIHAKLSAQQIMGPEATRTGWDNGELKNIDHILVKPKTVHIMRYEVVASPEGVFPSDHRPVLIDLIE